MTLVRDRLGDAVDACLSPAGGITVTVAPDRLLSLCRALRDEDDFRFTQLIDLCGIDYLEYGQADWRTSDIATAQGFSRAVRPRERVFGLDDDDETNDALQGGSPPSDAGEGDDGPGLLDSRNHDFRNAGDPRSGSRFAVIYHLLSCERNQRIRLRTAGEGDPPVIPSVREIWPVADWYEREAFDLFGILFDGHPDLRRILTDYGFVGHPFRKDFPLIGEVEMRYDPTRRRVIYEPVSITPRTLVPKVIRKTPTAGESGPSLDSASDDA
ncbi:NADH-quinone oxidoreductase subunit C [Thioalkalivibrio sp. HK1]|uniref:NADH-quinone oxidoreductase subunit C n=1 Tax=Thioalkalivibrio sp. HK1 TaxID=1469245 RepID=UPI0006860ABC|nr:NADH-quinone oxidoreductase subunit C [Thioalkalivibrio sp. HK1]